MRSPPIPDDDAPAMLRSAPLPSPHRAPARVASSALFALALAPWASCERARGPAPGWSSTPANALRGEVTLTGTPAHVRRLDPSAHFVVDGKLDEPAWATAAALGPFVDPGAGAAVPQSPVAGFARVAWTSEVLYL